MSTIRRCHLALLACLVLVSTADAKDAFTWQSNLEQAKQEAAQTNRLVLVHFWAPWCGPCRRLDREVFSRPAVAEAVSANYVTVKVNVDENRALANSYGIRGIPADVIVTPNGQVVKSLQSPATPDQYSNMMGQIAASVRPHPTNQMLAQANGANPPPMAQNPAASMQPAAVQPRIGTPGNNYVPPAGQVASVTPPPAAPNHQAQLPPQAPPPAAPNPQAQMPPQAPPVGGAPPTMPPPAAANGQLATNAPQANYPLGQPTVQQPAPQPQMTMTPAVSPGIPPQMNAPVAAPNTPPRIALDGCCPVSIVDQVGVNGAQWVLGQPQFGATYQGQVFYLASEEARQRFLADPARYAPVTFGNDPVLAIDKGQMVPGNRTHALYFGNRMYLFANEATLTAFVNDRFRYSAAAVSQSGRPQGPQTGGLY